MNRSEFSVRNEPVDLGEIAREVARRHDTSALAVPGRARRRRGGVVGRGRPGPPAPGRVESRRERAPRDAGGRDGHDPRRARRVSSSSDIGPRDRGRGHPARLRALLPLRQDRQGPAGRQRARPRDRAAARRRDGRRGDCRERAGPRRDVRRVAAAVPTGAASRRRRPRSRRPSADRARAAGRSTSAGSARR